MRQRGFLLVLLSLFAALADARGAGAQALRKVHATIPALTESSIAFFIAKERGYWREEGLAVELSLARAAPSIRRSHGRVHADPAR